MLLPNEVLFILEKLKPFDAYIVGGCVRDSILGQTPADWDITTSATPQEVKSIFEKTFDTGIKHGTVTVLVNKKPFEVTTFRKELEYCDHRHPSGVLFSKDIETDLSRRDFTINAIAYNPERGLVDPFGGQKDIKDEIIKTVGVPNERFEEDALRILRAFRFRARFNFVFEEKTKEAIKLLAPLISFVSKERIRDEFLRIIESNTSTLIEMNELGIIEIIFKGITNKNIENICKFKDENYVVKLAAFLENSELENNLKNLRLDKRTQKLIYNITTNLQEKPKATPHEIRKYISHCGKEVFSNLLTAWQVLKVENADLIKKIFDEIIKSNDPLFLEDIDLKGKDLISIGKSGNDIGTLLKKALEIVLENPKYNKKEILIEKLNQTGESVG